MVDVKIISLVNPTPISAPYVERISHKHSKYVRRKQYVDEVLLPALGKINYFRTVEVFPAITPDDFVQSEHAITYKQVQLNFQGTFPANFLSNYVLWKECVEKNKTMLILEDDAFLPSQNIQTIISAIEQYEKLPSLNSILYLLSQCPQNTQMKEYKKSKLISFNDNFFEWIPDRTYTSSDDLYEDVSGTAAYVVTPTVAKLLCEFAEKTGAECTDRFVGRACSENKISIFIPNQFDKLFLLHEQLEDWNITHKNSTPPKWEELPDDWKSAFLMGNTIQMVPRYVDEMNNVKQTFTLNEVEEFIRGAKNREHKKYGTYGLTDEWLYEALDMISIENQSVAVMGSIRPWYESVALAFGGKPTTVEYNLPNFKHPLIQETLLREVLLSGKQFDVAFSISSFEHDGLGRYGDPLNPDGDLRAMWEMKKILKPNGIMFLAVPCGLDKIAWNAHRIYGTKRLRLLLNLWEVVGTVGYEPENLFVDTGDSGIYQPIFVLKNI